MSPKQPILKNLLKDLTPAFLRQIISPKNLNILCIGTPKSGTTSIANLFSQGYRYEHEGERYPHVKSIHDHFSGNISDETYKKHLKKRAHRLWLDIESNCFLGYRIDLVYKVFPKAKYILTIRDPFSWLNSIFDNNLNFPVNNGFTEKLWHEYFFKPNQYDFSSNEIVLKDLNLYPLDAYLNYWVEANKTAIDAIPSSQLLIIYTNQISHKLDELSKFLNIDENSLNTERSKMNVTERKYNIMDKLDTLYVKERIEAVCGEFINSYSLEYLNN